MTERWDTIIIGGGQAGLAMSYYLQQHEREHVVLERARIAERWRTERWDSLRFQFINQAIELPGLSYQGPEPEGFAHHTAVTRFIEHYAAKIAAPVRQGVEVTRLRHRDTGDYALETNTGSMRARNVVVATGPFQRPMVPAAARDLPRSVYQVYASNYRSPDELPPGAVLVVGSGASGSQIADELQQSGRNVYLSVSPHRRVPRRYRGKDVLWWFDKMGRFEITIDSFPEQRYPPSTVVTGVNGGYDMNVRRFARDGGTVLGRVLGCADGKLLVAGDASQILAEADRSYDDFVSAAEALAEKPEVADHISDGNERSATPILAEVGGARSVDISGENVSSVIWGTGYLFDYNWIDLPIFDSRGAPVQQRGVTAFPGLYFLGLHWMHTFGSGLLSYVGRDAAHIARCMEALGSPAPSGRSPR
ncbi:NAD(P)/FAD-dependent oxidoreductase [Mesorhizobium sp. M0184]|uniref:flavin-containing monooxygenase n=2 Tax=unclassified Mesorhizobium TaxID=325217 RepID=UPI00333DFC7B